MAESKWAEAEGGESKWGDRREEKQGEGAGRRAGKGAAAAGGARGARGAGPAPAPAHAGAGAGTGESKFADEREAAAPASDETALVVATTVFGNDPIVCRLVDFWGTSLSQDINSR
jgi:hypothetical protein